MAKEIELKYLVRDRSYKAEATGKVEIRQAYLSSDPDATVRLRVHGTEAFLTVKTRNHGAERGEWEYAIPVADAMEMLRLSGRPCLSKTRWLVPAGDGLQWEVDEFHHPVAGLTLAELEIPSADYRPATLPGWIGEEVTGRSEYYNSNIAARFTGAE